MTGRLIALALAGLVATQLAAGQSPNPAPKPADPNVQFMEQLMRTATAVHDLVKSMNLEKALNSQPIYPPGDPRNLQRTADFMGVGAGVGLALGEMSHSQKGVLIGAAAGSAGGLIVDQLLRHQAAKAQAAPPPGQ